MKGLAAEERAEIQKAENVRSVKLYNWKYISCIITSSNIVSFCCIVHAKCFFSVLVLIGLHVYAHVHAHAQFDCVL